MRSLFDEARKYNVRFHVAFQHLSQLTKDKRDAVLGAATGVVFRVTAADAGALEPLMLGQADKNDLMVLPPLHAFARIGTHVARIEVPLPATRGGQRDAIIAASRDRYYRPAAEVDRAFQRKHGTARPLPSSRAAREWGPNQDYAYDEFT
jgi:hypothetical protein